VTAEEALDRAVHLVWEGDAAARAVSYEIQRRRRADAAWTDWQDVASAPAGARHADDAGPGGGGLAPGEYAYRIRGRYGAAEASEWSDWSEPQSVTLSPQCAPPPGQAASLPRVLADDRDADGRYTGRDLEQALRDCAGHGGCILEALPETYDDVAVLLYNGDRAQFACYAQRTACLDLAFPKGLVLQGHGSATVFRSPLWKTPYNPAPVFELWKRPDIPIVLRNLVLDGRKAEQVDPRRGPNLSNSWFHYGFNSWNQWGDHGVRNRGGCLHNLTVRNFVSRGIALSDADGWSIEYCRVEDIGCDEGHTPCSSMTIPSLFGIPGYRSDGYGIMIGWHVDDVAIRHNEIRRVVKYAMGLKHGQDGMETTIRRPRVVGNRITDTSYIGIFLAGVEDGDFRDNLVASTHISNEPPELANSYNTFGISAMSRVERTAFHGNEIRETAGIGLNWQVQGSGNVLSGNRIVRSCRVKNPGHCVSPRERCYTYADLNIEGRPGTLRLVDNQVLETGCRRPIQVAGAPPPMQLTLHGGRYTRGSPAVENARFDGVDVTLQGGASFEGLGVEFGPGARGVVTPSVRADGPLSVERGSAVRVCAEERGYCQKICAAPHPPAWCSDRLDPEP
jgi:hypothetical protein